jgi:hypothetical protein
MIRYLKAGDEVAIMPAADSPPTDVLEIATIIHAGSVYLLISDGRMYATIGGKSFGSKAHGFAVPAMDAHRRALRQKLKATKEDEMQQCESNVQRDASQKGVKPCPA